MNHDAWYGGGITGLIGGAYYYLTLEMIVGLFESMAVMMVITFTVLIWVRNSQTVLKLAIIPGFISHVTYGIYAVFLDPSVEFNDICQILNSTAYPVILCYCWFNRRTCYGGKETSKAAEAKKAQNPAEETPSQQTQEEVLDDIPITRQARGRYAS